MNDNEIIQVLKGKIFCQHDKLSKTSSYYTMFLYIASPGLQNYKKINGLTKTKTLIKKNLNITLIVMDKLEEVINYFGTSNLCDAGNLELTNIGERIYHSVSDTDKMRYGYAPKSLAKKRKKLEEFLKQRMKLDQKIKKLKKELNEFNEEEEIHNEEEEIEEEEEEEEEEEHEEDE